MRKHDWLLALFLVLIQPFFSIAQDKKTAELEKQLAILKDQGVAQSDTNWINLSNSLAAAYANANPDTSLKIALQSLKSATDCGFSDGVIEAKRHVGYAYHLLGQESEAIAHLQSAIKLSEKSNNQTLLAKCHNTLAIVFKNQSKFSSALEHYLISLKIKTKQKDLKGQANTYGNIGILFKNLQDYNQAASYYDRALQIFKRLNDSSGISTSLGNLGLMYLHLKDFKKAEKVIPQSIVWKLELGDVRGLAFDYSHLGNLFFETNRLDSAIYYYRKAHKMKIGIGDPIPIAVTANDISAYYLRIGKVDSALFYANLALEKSKALSNLEVKCNAHQQLASAYDKSRDFKSAYYHLSQAALLKDSMRQEIFSKKMSVMEIKLHEQIQYERQKAYQELHESKLAKQRYWLLAIGVVVLLLAIVTFYLFRERFKLSQSNWQLKQAHAEISRQHREIELKSEELAQFNTALIQQKEEVSFLNKHLQLKIEERTQSLEKQNASLKNYAFSVSHLLRKHAANIIGLTDLLNQANNNSAEYQEILHHLTISSHNLDETIREMNHQLQAGLLDHPDEELPGNSNFS